MGDACSEVECVGCGKQLWKAYWVCNYVDEEPVDTYCSKACGIRHILKNIQFERIELDG